eukprot:202281_1
MGCCTTLPSQTNTVLLIDDQTKESYQSISVEDHTHNKQLFEIDYTDKENNKNLDQLISKYNKTDRKITINSKYLFFSHTIPIEPQIRCPLSKCVYLQRLRNILQAYHIFSSDQAKNNININNIFPKSYNNTNLLNDYNHLLFRHSSDDEFECIYNILISTINDEICPISSCLLMRRNYRNRSTLNNQHMKLQQLYCENDDKDIVKQQLLDRIHSYYFHTFDIGFKLKKIDKINILRANVKDDDNKESVNDSVYDINVININQHIQQQSKYTTFNPNNKFSSNLSFLEFDANVKNYSYGYRYYYWKCYEKNDNTTEPASQLESFSQQLANKNSRLCDWFVPKKYENFKEEILSNAICQLNAIQWLHLQLKAEDHLDTDYFRSFQCVRDKTAIYYDMKYGDQLKINHLISLMIYCNYEVLQFKFTETYRLLNMESLKSMQQRHRNFYFLGKCLRECVECFGMIKRQFDGKGKFPVINVYHGVNKEFNFSSLFAYIKAPFSTTLEYFVAANFSANKGMILGLDILEQEWTISCADNVDAGHRLSCFDCSWISDFPFEREIFCIGGLHKFTFNTIIVVNQGINYEPYINGLQQLTNFMTCGDSWAFTINWARTDVEKQMVFRLLLHELYRSFPNHKYAFEFKGCPMYIKHLLHSHFRSIRKIIFEEDIFFPHNEVAANLFKYDNGWIKINLIMTLFPNMLYIYYNAT